MLPIDPIGDTGFDMLSNFPDDHEIFAHAPKEISEVYPLFLTLPSVAA